MHAKKTKIMGRRVRLIRFFLHKGFIALVSISVGERMSKIEKNEFNHTFCDLDFRP